MQYDPAQPRTIPEIQAAAAAKGKAKANSDAGSDDWEDDNNNEDDDEEEDSANDTDFADSDDDEASAPSLAPRATDPNAPAPTVTELRERLQQRIADIQANKRGSAPKPAAEGAVQSKEELLEDLRARRGLLRDNRRKKRKAERRGEKAAEPKERVPSNGRKGGGKANAPEKVVGEDGWREDRFGNRPQTREVEVEERPTKRSKGSVEPEQAVVSATKAVAPVAKPAPKPAPDASALTFSTLDFSTSALLAAQAGRDKAGKRKNRHDLPKDANAALEVLAARKAKLEELDPEKREKAEDKARWEKVELKASGEKVRDDEKRLKKMAKRQEKIKSKSAKAWAERKETVATSISSKIKKRNENLAARVKAGKDKKAGVKTATARPKTKSKSHAGRQKTGGGGGGRAGFEGKGKK